jgi:hypothetical protein
MKNWWKKATKKHRYKVNVTLEKGHVGQEGEV